MGFDEQLIYAQGQFWVAGNSHWNGGVIYSSPEGRTWTPRLTSFWSKPPILNYEHGLFLSFSDPRNFHPMISLNGVDWSVSPGAGMPEPIHAVASGGGRFVAVGESHVFWSRDGLTWQLSWTNAQAFTVVQYVNQGFVAATERLGIAENGFYPGELLAFSSDGEQWSFYQLPGSPKPPLYPLRVAYGNGKYVVVSSAVYTFSATHDVQVIPEAPDLVTVLFTDRFIGAGLGGIYESQDGSSWQRRSEHWATSLAYGGGKYVAYGAGGVMISGDGVSWTPQFLTERGFPAIAYGNGRFVAPASSEEFITNAFSRLLTSENGVNWLLGDLKPTEYVGALIYTNGFFIGLQKDGKGISSQDGLAWEHFQTGLNRLPRSLTFSAGLYWTVTDEPLSPPPNGQIARSPDGRSWTTVATYPDYELRGIASSGSNVVAVGLDKSNPGGLITGVILSSADGGASWSKKLFERGLYGIAYGANRFVAVGNFGAALSSPDGINWQQKSLGMDDLFTVNYANNQFVAAGDNASATPQFPLWTSTDGAAWQSHSTDTSSGYVQCSALGANSWVFGGWAGIGQTDPLLPQFDPLARQSDRDLRLRLVNSATNHLRIESSADLIKWEPVTNSASADIRLSITAGEARRMFRAVTTDP